MRTTLRIDDDLLRTLKELARQEEAGLAEMVNRFLRRGLEAARCESRQVTKDYREQVFSMGPPAVDLRKALALAADLEDQQILEKLARRK